MSFNVNIASAKPVIRESANMNNDGGGGNLGYMTQGENDEQKHKPNESIFSKQETDTFDYKKDFEIPKEKFSFAKLIAELIYAVKKFFS